MPRARKAPIERAKTQKIGTVTYGLDGNKWIVIKTKSNLRKWIRYNPSKHFSQDKQKLLANHVVSRIKNMKNHGYILADHLIPEKYHLKFDDMFSVKNSLFLIPSDYTKAKSLNLNGNYIWHSGYVVNPERNGYIQVLPGLDKHLRFMKLM